VRIIAFALLLDRCIPKSANRRTQTFDRLIPNPERFRQSVFRSFALGIEGLLGRRNLAMFPASERINRKTLQNILARTGFALTLSAHREDLGLLLVIDMDGSVQNKGVST
jgi:hypothetical protein